MKVNYVQNMYYFNVHVSSMKLNGRAYVNARNQDQQYLKYWAKHKQV